ncbi:dynactin subunit 6-like [Condylostylus longicornis]|uniref:dynactin subunit 6-like n=1 Tax=Condylostylus longicornis TaxID=2530218 RepID=UPI00244E2CFD|nr:dynactin subunit 6-like [Condylostylus longicornis]
MVRAVIPINEINGEGDITFYDGCIVHPKVTITAESGPIIFGKNCIIGENSTIIFKVPENLKSEERGVMKIGANTVIGNGCTIKSLKIGERNVIGCNCYISEKVEIGNGCIISSNTRLVESMKLNDNTIM